jgi:hypothetical protein
MQEDRPKVDSSPVGSGPIMKILDKAEKFRQRQTLTLIAEVRCDE